MSSKDDFFIGYQKAPAIDRRWFLLAAPALVAGAAGMGSVLSGAQSHPGHGSWDLDNITRIAGTLVRDPYAALIIPTAEGGQQRVLLVSEGKSSPLGNIDQCLGDQVEIAGNLLLRDGNRMLSIPPILCQTPTGSAAQLAPTPNVSIGAVTLTGMIIDTKCFFGAMRPGMGKVHKGCATLCIKGGIPAGVYAKDDEGRETIAVLTTLDSSVMPDSILPLVADRVQMSGQMTVRDGLSYLAVDPTKIERV
ncbi:hypothetical protein [Pyruvatibacter sp.]|uniref:hypothetical protein n=1 Tax=Pyruvatibacter sp. TaxID=1981328 RepID=UPI003266C253